MKKLSPFLFIFLFETDAFSQYKSGFLRESFFERQPSARAEAMGRGYSAFDGDLSSVFFNPAGIATIKGNEINISYATPYYLLRNAKYIFTGAGCRIKDYLVIGLSRNHFSFGEEWELTTPENPDGTGEKYTPGNSNFTLSLSSQPFKDFLVGLNSNYFIYEPVKIFTPFFYFDMGCIKKFRSSETVKANRINTIGFSITNFTFSSMKWEGISSILTNQLKSGNSDLPVILRIGAANQYNFGKNFLMDTVNTIEFTLQVELQKIINADYDNYGISFGYEMVVFEILAIRAGYYYEYEKVVGIGAHESHKTAFTLGHGIVLSLYQWSKIPLKINFDFTSLPQTKTISTNDYSYYYNNYSFENFTSLNLRINYIFRK